MAPRLLRAAESAAGNGLGRARPSLAKALEDLEDGAFADAVLLDQLQLVHAEFRGKFRGRGLKREGALRRAVALVRAGWRNVGIAGGHAKGDVRTEEEGQRLGAPRSLGNREAVDP
jgi:hypothetical protein